MKKQEDRKREKTFGSLYDVLSYQASEKNIVSFFSQAQRKFLLERVSIVFFTLSLVVRRVQQQGLSSFKHGVVSNENKVCASRLTIFRLAKRKAGLVTWTRSAGAARGQCPFSLCCLDLGEGDECHSACASSFPTNPKVELCTHVFRHFLYQSIDH